MDLTPAEDSMTVEDPVGAEEAGGGRGGKIAKKNQGREEWAQ